jgi:hypothetical protein
MLLLLVKMPMVLQVALVLLLLAKIVAVLLLLMECGVRKRLTIMLSQEFGHE